MLQVQNQFRTPLSETGYLVAGVEGVDLLAPRGNQSGEALAQRYRAAIFTADIDATMAQVIVDFVSAGGAALVYGDAVQTAITQGWMTEEFLGLRVLPPASPVTAVSVFDEQTGWVSASYDPFCVPQDAAAPLGTAYIKTSGNASHTTG